MNRRFLFTLIFCGYLTAMTTGAHAIPAGNRETAGETVPGDQMYSDYWGSRINALVLNNNSFITSSANDGSYLFCACHSAR